eukprot:CAMPEP_0194062864 /NCGR_PEP_ID=MMETSP0009_2-20130614/78766_1 /TAXON_ID=210454 /ORGANISM="Grammatophora oceanica, Strain CCMP 410" /LENGTH=49 /DNA_ID=CAMNT_0038714775 /DNA_START=947 /DNA_END=1096 /DNA_ORIENTATION=+
MTFVVEEFVLFRKAWMMVDEGRRREGSTRIVASLSMKTPMKTLNIGPDA